MHTEPGQGSGQPAGPRENSAETVVAVGGYVMLLVLGALEALVGTFQFSRTPGSLPVAAVGFALAIGVTCVLGAWGMHRPLGGLLPGAGWLLTALFLAMATPGGSVLITSTGPGEWFLFGGAACTAAGVVTGFVRWSPKRPHLAALPQQRTSPAAPGSAGPPPLPDQRPSSSDSSARPKLDDAAEPSVDAPAGGASERDTSS
jgi:hypothetical protein